MGINVGATGLGGGSEEAFRHASDQFIFRGTDKAAAERARDKYIRDNSLWVEQFRPEKEKFKIFIVLEDIGSDRLYLQLYDEHDERGVSVWDPTKYRSAVGVKPDVPLVIVVRGQFRISFSTEDSPTADRLEEFIRLFQLTGTHYDVGDPFQVHLPASAANTGRPIRINAAGDFTLAPAARGYEDVWDNTWLDNTLDWITEDAAQYRLDWPAAPQQSFATGTRRPHITRTGTGNALKIELRIPFPDTQAGAVTKLLTQYKARKASAEWGTLRATFTDSATPTNKKWSNVPILDVSEGIISGDYQYWSFELDKTGDNANIPAGFVTYQAGSIQANLPTKYTMNLRLTSTAGSIQAADVPSAEWDFLDHDTDHWFDVGQITGASSALSGLTSQQVNALIQAALVNATETRRGLVELATTTEVTTGTDTERAVTPAGVKAAVDAIPAPPDASTTAKGLIEIATRVEATTGTDNTRAMTPLRVKQVIDTIDDHLLRTVSDLSTSNIVTFTADDGSTIKSLDLSSLAGSSTGQTGPARIAVDFTTGSETQNAADLNNWGEGRAHVVIWAGSSAATITLADGPDSSDRTYLVFNRGGANLTIESIVAKPGESLLLTWNSSSSTWGVTAFVLPSGGGSAFTPSKTNLYSAVKAIFHPDNTNGLSADDTNNELDLLTLWNLANTNGRLRGGAIASSDRVFVGDDGDSDKVKWSSWTDFISSIWREFRKTLKSPLARTDRIPISANTGNTPQYATVNSLLNFIPSLFSTQLSQANLANADRLYIADASASNAMKYMTLSDLINFIHAGGSSADKLYFGGLAADPTSSFDPTDLANNGLQSADVPAAGVQTVTLNTASVTPAWSAGRRNIYLIQKASIRDIQSITVDNLANTGWSAQATFTHSGITYEWRKSPTQWLFSSANGATLGITRA